MRPKQFFTIPKLKILIPKPRCHCTTHESKFGPLRKIGPKPDPARYNMLVVTFS
jgi:hypothetical protein